MTSGRRLARAAALIALITVAARLAGFARTAVFGHAVGVTCVGQTYQTANTIPNIVFDVVAGGLLSALVVPILAPGLAPGAAGDPARTGRLASALLTWAVTVLVPVALVIAVAAEPIVRVLLSDHGCAGAVDLGARLLRVFAVQVVFYGVGVVLSGVLSAGERFTWPALAPLLSSVTVIAAYLLYGALAHGVGTAVGLPASAEAALGVGTTAGVVVLAGCLMPAALRLGLRWRPTWRFPSGVGPSVRTAALAGAATLAAQQGSTAVMIALANRDTAAGTLVVLTTAQAVFLLPWAVLSLPVATATFPRLSAAWDAGRRAEFGDRLTDAAGVVVAAAAAGTAVLVAIAQPAGPVLLSGQRAAIAGFAPAVVAFAVGLLGWSLVALVSRALYAARAVVASAVAQVAGQLTVIAADVVLALLLPARLRTVALAAGNSVGVVLAAALLVGLAARRGALPHVTALVRTVLTGAAGAAFGAVAGWAVGRLARGQGVLAGLGLGVVAAAVAVSVFVAVLAVLDRTALRALVGRLRTVVRA